MVEPCWSPSVVVAYQEARERYAARSEKTGRPKVEVDIWIQVFPAEPTKSDEEAMEESPVPPRVAESVPVQPGVKVWVEPDEVTASVMFVSLVVAKDCESVARPFKEVMPEVVAVMHSPPAFLKQPPESWMPFVAVVVAPESVSVPPTFKAPVAVALPVIMVSPERVVEASAADDVAESVLRVRDEEATRRVPSNVSGAIWEKALALVPP